MAIKPAETIEETMVPKPCPIPAGLVCATPEATLVEGGVACGKTQALVEHTKSLLDAGVAPHDVLVLCAAPDAAGAFASRLADACPGGACVRVTTPREWCRDFLASRPAREGSDRGVRMLAPFEVDVLMEDLKVDGMRPQRLREMLKFFYKSITELCDWEEDWLLTGEEIKTYGTLRECLDFEGAVLEAEVSNKTVRLLRDDPQAFACHAVAHVVVDDYQMLSRASQVLANELATTSIAIAANPMLAVEVFESYPYEAGVEEFLAANPQAKHVVLSESHACAAACAAVNGIAAHELVGAGQVKPSAAPGAERAVDAAAGLLVAHAETPASERDLVARLVQEALDRGERPQDVTVAVPNLVWGRNVCAALEAKGVPTASPSNPRSVSGDLRELDLCVPARVLTALYLVADPGDGVAWRSWCGFGNLFASSSAVCDIRTSAVENRLGAAEAFSTFEAAAMGDVNRAEWECVLEAQQSALQLLAGAEGKSGDDLLHYVVAQVAGEGAEVPESVAALVAPMPDGSLAGDDAAAMAARARLRIDAPRAGVCDGVRVVPFADVTGTTPTTLIVCGFVNGFFPIKGVLDRELLVQEDADKQMAKDLRLLMNVVGKPSAVLGVTYFDEIVLEMAERMRMKMHRVQLHDGRRVALSEPSVYLDVIKG